MKHTSLIITLLCFGFTVSAQKPNASLQKANLLYTQKAYSDAIPLYEKAIKTDSSNKLILSNLGDCYRLTNNTNGQLVCYGGLVKKGSADPIQELYYGQALMENGEVEKARPYFEKFTADNRGQSLASSADKMKSYSRNADAYSLVFANFNSPQNDFCAVKFNEALVFVSTRTKTVWIKKEQGWTDGNYSTIYATEDGTPPVLFMGDLDSKYNDGPVCFSKDYNTVYFTRNSSKKSELAKDGTYKLKILEASLDQNGFSMVKVFPFNNKDYNVAHPSISSDGYTMFFASDMEGGKGGMDIYITKKDSSGVWGAPVNMGDKINTAGNEVFPFIASNNMLYFSSNGRDGLGGLDIYENKLVGSQAGKTYNMGEPVNSKNDDFGIFLNEDNKSGYISSNRKNGGLDDDIYSMLILREVKRGKDVLIITKDKTTGEPVANTKVLINADTVVTNDKGEYATTVEEGQDYKLETFKTDYFKAEDNMSATSSLDDAFTKELVMEKDPKLFLKAIITDAKSGAPLDSVNIKVTDIVASSEFDPYTTTAAGDYYKFLYGKKVGDKLTYLVRIDKKGYLQRTVVFTHEITRPGEIDMNQDMNLAIGKVEVGMDLAKMIDMKPIYFDLGKSTIRKDAAMELDKVVQVMNEYPNMFVELGAHTDCRGGAAANMKLSTARAKASAAYIVKKGINKLRITGKGYGESKLLNTCACEGKVQSTCSEEEHSKNRRTEFIITKLK
jgi:outer membrane protein OmpA-like peptidoglycan-associated protein